MTRRLGLLLGLLLPALCLAAGAARAGGVKDYKLGHGIDLGPFNFAGYSNLVAKAPRHGSRALVLDDLSLFVAGHAGRFVNPFAETEFTQFDIARSASAGSKRRNGDLVLERLYNDAYLTNTTTLRLGKMLTPVGQWNEVHAAPLVLTTVRPAVTHRNFSEYTTGLSVLYSDPYARFPDVQVYWQPSGELSERPSSLTVHRYDRVAGAHVSFPIGLLDKIGLSFQHSKDVDHVVQSLYGLDFHYTFDKLTLQGEGTFSDINEAATAHARDTEWGAYAAASYALTDKWSVHGWYEGFADRTRSSVAQDLLFGFAYRPLSAMVLRAEYLENVGGKAVNPSGLFASWSVLF